MRFVRGSVCAVGALALAVCAAADFDSIGASNASTNGGTWPTSATNTDAGGDVSTACGVGIVTVPAGRRPIEIQAVIGTRGPGGAGSANLAAITNWQVHFWSDQTAFGAAPATGNVKSITYSAPTNANFATPYGSDVNGRPTYLVKFHLPGGINLSQTLNSYFAVRVAASQSTVGFVGVLESTATGPSGLWASQTFVPPGYIPFVTSPFHTRNGVFAYRVVAGCPADHNADGSVTVQDLFDYLGAWFSVNPGADFNGTGGVTVQDLFDYLGRWFANC